MLVSNLMSNLQMMSNGCKTQSHILISNYKLKNIVHATNIEKSFLNWMNLLLKHDISNNLIIKINQFNSYIKKLYNCNDIY